MEDRLSRDFCLCHRYTAKFDKIVLDRTVVSVSELHVPEVFIIGVT